MNNSPSKYPENVQRMARRLTELHPGARIEVEPRWFVRAYVTIATSNINHELCIDARNLRDAS